MVCHGTELQPPGTYFWKEEGFAAPHSAFSEAPRDPPFANFAQKGPEMEMHTAHTPCSYKADGKVRGGGLEVGRVLSHQ